MNKFSEKLIALRKQHRLKQREVGQFIGVSERVYAYWEKGRFPCKPEYFIKICELYEISPNDLFCMRIKYIYNDECE